MEHVEYAIWLQRIFGPGSPRAAALLKTFGGAEQIYGATQSQLAAVPGLTRREYERLSDKSLAACEKIVGDCMKNDYRIVAWGDVAYPPGLREIYAPPCVLYVSGSLPGNELTVAVVGTRRITEYGSEAATRLSVGLAHYGASVVSGLAVGVDAAAHKGALKGGGKTYAVIGCGIDVDYPAPNRELKRLISRNGGVISEYPPGTPPLTMHFPIRNRIIAGLAPGTLVIEAGGRSGSLITAGLAAEMGRDVFAVPGSIFSPMSEGTNRLIRDGAKPCLNVMDILEEYPAFFPDGFSAEETAASSAALSRDVPVAQSKETPARAPRPVRLPAGLTKVQADVYGKLTRDPTHVDQIALSCNLELKVVLAALTTLEIQGLARSEPGRRFALV